MKNLSVALLLLSVLTGLTGLTGCGDGFPDEEMHFGIENKVRPYAVVIEPPEAAPGDTVLITLLARTPDPDELDITWRVALDFDTGLYETDEVERLYRDLASPLPSVDADGFLGQSFQWVVPDSVMLYSSALPEVLDDPAMVILAEELIGPGDGSPLTKSAVDAWFKAMTADQLAAMDPPERMTVWALADLFACQVRFRATLRTDLIIDVTRNLTIRHTARLGGPNSNHNAGVTRLAVVALEKEDATCSDLDDPGVTRTRYPFIEDGVRVADRVQVPGHEQWTYYLKVEFEQEQYTSPFDPGLMLVERGEYRWYYYRQDDPLSGHHFFVNEDGDEAEMWDLSDEARIKPAGSGSMFRVVVAVRDERSEWVMYHAVPGTGVEEGIVEFIAP